VASYAFDVVPADVVADELEFAQQTDSDLLEGAIDRAAGDLNPQLRAKGIDPASITEANYPDDYNWCRKTIIVGAAGYYMRSVTGSWEAGRDKLDAEKARIDQFSEFPQLLAAYSPNASSANAGRSRVNYDPGPVTDTQTRRARDRMLNPADPNRWRQ
jgi:hypothetical protein